MLKNQNLVVIGTGTMGSAIIKGLQSSIGTEKIKAVELNIATREYAKKDLHIDILSSSEYENVIPSADIILICVKPKDFKKCINSFKPYLKKDTIVVSIAAGVRTNQIEEMLGYSNPVIRSMPNTPCLIKEGMIVVSRGKYAKDNDIKLCVELFSSVGQCIELEEKLLNAVTGLSGCGPAYVYLIIDALSDGGVMEGLTKKDAITLVTQTIIGSAKMVQQTGKHPAQLKDDVSTPAGCTIGGVLTMEDGGLRSILAKGVRESTKIAGKLG